MNELNCEWPVPKACTQPGCVQAFGRPFLKYGILLLKLSVQWKTRTAAWPPWLLFDLIHEPLELLLNTSDICGHATCLYSFTSLLRSWFSTPLRSALGDARKQVHAQPAYSFSWRLSFAMKSSVEHFLRNSMLWCTILIPWPVYVSMILHDASTLTKARCSSFLKYSHRPAFTLLFFRRFSPHHFNH